VDEVGPSGAARFPAFGWPIAGRALEAPAGWQRARPPRVVRDEYPGQTRQTVAAAAPQFAGAQGHWRSLPSSCPTWSALELDRQVGKQQLLPGRRFAHVADLKRAVAGARERQAHQRQ
jgi:hypothetical protein